MKKIQKSEFRVEGDEARRRGGAKAKRRRSEAVKRRNERVEERIGQMMILSRDSSRPEVPSFHNNSSLPSGDHFPPIIVLVQLLMLQLKLSVDPYRFNRRSRHFDSVPFRNLDELN